MQTLPMQPYPTPVPARRLVRSPRIWFAVAVIAMAACHSTTPEPGLTGDWATFPNPGGGGWSFSFTTTGTSVSGTGSLRGIGPNGTVSAAVVTGVVMDGQFSLNITVESEATPRTYAGSFATVDQLVGTLSAPGGSSTLTLDRQ
ncbi:MAG: hypothetical protein ABI647_08275 [Gemmatimonadota bacterium]